MFSRVLVANRGEIAVRVIRALHELGIEAVAVYSTADEDALHVRLADRAVRIGPPPASESYLRIPLDHRGGGDDRLRRRPPGLRVPVREPRVRARLRGERPRLRRAGRRGDGAHGRQGAGEGGDAAPRTCRSCPAPTAARRVARRARGGAASSAIPVLLKAAAGGGGKGMRLVARRPPSSRTRSRPRPPRRRPRSGTARSTSRRRSTRRGTSRSRCSATAHGGVLTLGERECSIQRRHQKLVEESPSPALTPETREEMEAAAERACRAIGYRNAGTFEFLLGPDGSFYFIELNARLQVEHPVSELVTGIDVVREQLRIAAGERLSLTGRAPRRGHAIEVRINAEDPARGFRPAPGRVDALPPAARAGRAARHVPRGGRRRAAVLRLAAREARRLGRGPRRGDRAGAARAAASSSSRACRRRAGPRSTSSRARSSRAASTRRASWRGTATGSRRWRPREPRRLQRDERRTGTVSITLVRARAGGRGGRRDGRRRARPAAAARARPRGLRRSRARVGSCSRPGRESSSPTRPAACRSSVAGGARVDDRAGLDGRRGRSRRSSDGGRPGEPADGAVPALPVGPDRSAARRPVRGRAGRGRAGARARRSRRGRPSSTGGSPTRPRTGRPTGSGRSSATSCGSASTSWTGRGAGRGRGQRGGRAGEALRVGRGGAARERDPRRGCAREEVA